jgi:hypothetical protein
VLTVTVWAMTSNLVTYVRDGQWALTAVGATILGLALWVCVEAVIALVGLKRAARAASEAPAGH